MHIVYTDGGKRKGIGAYAFVIVRASHHSYSGDYSGTASGPIIGHGFGLIDPLINSAEAEIVAAREAINYVRQHSIRNPLLVSDNMYVVYGVRNPHKMMRNRDTYDHVWKPILEHVFKDPIHTQHVKGHRQHTFNTLADFMCNELLAGRGDKLERKLFLFEKNELFRKSLVRTRK